MEPGEETKRNFIPNPSSTEGERFRVAVYGQERVFLRLIRARPSPRWIQNAIQLLDNLSNGISATCASLSNDRQFRIREFRAKSDKLFISALIYVFHIVVRFLFIHRKLEGNELVLVTRSMREFFNRIDESERIVRNTVENCIRLNFESS